MSEEERVILTSLLAVVALWQKYRIMWQWSYYRTCVMWVLVLIYIVSSSLWALMPGMLANAAVICANGGKMPVFPSMFCESELHCNGTASTRLAWLADRFSAGPVIFSLGDVLIWLGVVLTCGVNYVAH